jgi:hypothetical protein
MYLDEIATPVLGIQAFDTSDHKRLGSYLCQGGAVFLNDEAVTDDVPTISGSRLVLGSITVDEAELYVPQAWTMDDDRFLVADHFLQFMGIGLGPPDPPTAEWVNRARTRPTMLVLVPPAPDNTVETINQAMRANLVVGGWFEHTRKDRHDPPTSHPGARR